MTYGEGQMLRFLFWGYLAHCLTISSFEKILFANNLLCVTLVTALEQLWIPVLLTQ